MGIFRKECFHRSYPRDVVDKVDQMLAEGIFLRVIAAQTGISKSSIHRHKTNCYRDNAPSRCFDETRDLVTLEYAGQKPAPPPPPHKWKKNSIWFAVVVEYEKPIEIKPKSDPVGTPKAQISTQENPDIVPAQRPA